MINLSASVKCIRERATSSIAGRPAVRRADDLYYFSPWINLHTFALKGLLSSFQSNGPRYDVETGRRDGKMSAAYDADNDLPPPSSKIVDLKTYFSFKGLGWKDLVVLSGILLLSLLNYCFLPMTPTSLTNIQLEINASKQAIKRHICSKYCSKN